MPRSKAAAVRRIEEELRALAVPGRAEAEKRYLKSELVHLGTPVPAIRKVAKALVREQRDWSSEELFALAEVLWDRRIHELRVLAAELLSLRAGVLTASDMIPLEGLIRESKTWALVDVLAPSVAGSIVERDPGALDVVDGWAHDPDFWVRRAALLTLLKPLRRGGGDFERFGRYAETMLEDKEFFIRKAIGWILRETSKKRPDLVYEWLAPRAHLASGVTIREAVKYLDPAQRDALLEAQKS